MVNIFFAYNLIIEDNKIATKIIINKIYDKKI